MPIAEYSIKLTVSKQALTASSSSTAQTGPAISNRVIKRPVSSSSSQSNHLKPAANQEVYVGFVAHPMEPLSAPSSYPLTPVVLILGTVRGLTAFEMQKAVEVAQQGYTAVAIDLYGDRHPFHKREDPNEIGHAFACMNELLANPIRLRALVNAWADLALSLPSVDKEYGYAMTGYCFGGSVCCEMVRAGNPNLRGIVSFHGIPECVPMHDMTGKPPPPMVSAKPANSMNPACRVLIETGGLDGMAPRSMIEKYEKELLDGGIQDFMVVTHGQATHGFAIPSPMGVDPKIVSHNRHAWIQSTFHMRSFLKALFFGGDKEKAFDLGSGASLKSQLSYKGTFNMGDAVATSKL